MKKDDKRLKNLKPFKKGTSGNPKGRPKGLKNRATVVRKWLDMQEKAKNPITGEIEGLTQEDIIILAAINTARRGNVHAFRELMDSVYGKSKETIQLEGGDRAIEYKDVTEIQIARNDSDE